MTQPDDTAATDGLAGRIAPRLEARFLADGFAAPGVDALKEAAEVSLRTLYKHFPSREAMVLAALEHRHRTYLAHLAADDGDPADEAPGRAAVIALFERLADWMAHRAPRGCLFLEACAADPASTAIRAMLERHKAQTRAVIRARLSGPAAACERLADALMIVHEGMVARAAVIGAEAARDGALAAVRALLEQQRGEQEAMS